MNHQHKYATCVGVTVALAMILGFSFQHSVDEKVALVSFGGPLLIYFNLARSFRAGELFNFALFGAVITGYLAIVLAPLYYMFRSFKWPLVFVQAGIIVVHFLIGLILAA